MNDVNNAAPVTVDMNMTSLWGRCNELKAILFSSGEIVDEYGDSYDCVDLWLAKVAEKAVAAAKGKEKAVAAK